MPFAGWGHPCRDSRPAEPAGAAEAVARQPLPSLCPGRAEPPDPGGGPDGCPCGAPLPVPVRHEQGGRHVREDPALPNTAQLHPAHQPLPVWLPAAAAAGPVGRLLLGCRAHHHHAVVPAAGSGGEPRLRRGGGGGTRTLRSVCVCVCVCATVHACTLLGAVVHDIIVALLQLIIRVYIYSGFYFLVFFISGF